MYEKELNELVMISQFVGKRVDYTQGGGGNTSVKLDDKIMAIKASGYKLMEITADKGYVTVDYKKLISYYNSVDLNVKKDYEKESSAVVKEAVTLLDGMENLRPSVEVGFHAVLKKYVIHIHSVYAAIIVCTKRGEAIIKKILDGKNYGFIFVPYINPGFSLSVYINKKVKEYEKEYGTQPEAIFMKNHGLVVHSDNFKRAKEVIKDINDEIRNYFGISDEEFGEIKFEYKGDNIVSATPVVVNFLKENTIDKDFLNSNPLYPDQLVYLNNCLIHTPEKLRFSGGSAVYSAVSLNEAMTLEETLAAFIFVITQIKKHNLPLSVMSKKDVDFINNWESEKYRRAISK